MANEISLATQTVDGEPIAAESHEPYCEYCLQKSTHIGGSNPNNESLDVIEEGEKFIAEIWYRSRPIPTNEMPEYSVQNIYHYHHYDDGELWLDSKDSSIGISHTGYTNDDVDPFEYADQKLGVSRNEYKDPLDKDFEIRMKEWQKYHQIVVVATAGSAEINEEEVKTDFFVEFSDGKYAIFEDVKPIMHSPPHQGGPF